MSNSQKAIEKMVKWAELVGKINAERPLASGVK